MVERAAEGLDQLPLLLRRDLVIVATPAALLVVPPPMGPCSVRWL
jgi:hypothetical protein